MQRRPAGAKRKRRPRPNLGAQRLRRWLSDTSTTQAALAKKLDVSMVSVFKWVSGRSVPRLRKAIGLRDLCGIAVEAWWEPEEGDEDGPVVRRTGTDG